jgi:integrase
VKTFRDALDNYLTMRRSLGFKLEETEGQLAKFVAFMQRKRATFITNSLVLEWAQQSQSGRNRPAKRLTMVRGLARYLSAFDPRTEVPPDNLLKKWPDRARPYLYSDQETRCLLEAAMTRSTCELNNRTYHCVFGLLAVSGIRIGEAIDLNIGDLDLNNGLMTIRKPKFGNTRVVPLHETTQHVLRDYRVRRDRFLDGRHVDPFFISNRGTRLFHTEIYRVFNLLSVEIGVRAKGDGRGPRLHDFRHRFAVRTLLQWYRSGQDVERLLPVLSTYLGHLRVTDTYWYLSACPELTGLAVQRLDRRWEGRYE